MKFKYTFVYKDDDYNRCIGSMRHNDANTNFPTTNKTGRFTAKANARSHTIKYNR